MFGGLVAAFITFWIAVSQLSVTSIVGWERSLFNVLYNLPVSLKPFFLGATFGGSEYMIVLVCAILWFAHHRIYAVRMFILSIITFGSTWVVKHIFKRPRPNLLLHYVTQRGPHEAGYGFPSAHAAVAMALGVALLPLVPKRWWWLIFVVVTLVGVSRVYLGVHAPLDVIGGFAIGAATSLSYLLIMAAHRYRNRNNIIIAKNKPV